MATLIARRLAPDWSGANTGFREGHDSMQEDFPGLLRALEQAGTDASLSRLREAAQAHPDDARPQLMMGATLAQEGRTDAAEAAYAIALEREPGLAIARFQLGLLQLTRRRVESAHATWSALDQLPPGDPLRLFKTAIEHLVKDDFSTAYRLLLQGMAANTANPPLNRAMQQLADRLPQPQRALAGAGADGSRETAAHFLVSAYCKPD